MTSKHISYSNKFKASSVPQYLLTYISWSYVEDMGDYNGEEFNYGCSPGYMFYIEMW